MGMTIDIVDKWLKIQRQNLVNSSESAKDKKIESLDTAMSYLEDYQQLLRKYQKIEQIMKRRHGRYHIEIVQEIKEALEDGNNNL